MGRRRRVLNHVIADEGGMDNRPGSSLMPLKNNLILIILGFKGRSACRGLPRRSAYSNDAFLLSCTYFFNEDTRFFAPFIMTKFFYLAYQ